MFLLLALLLVAFLLLLGQLALLLVLGLLQVLGFLLGVGALLSNPTVQSVAAEYSKTPAQVLIRWSLQLGNSVIPRSSSPERIAENFDVFDFELTESDMAALSALDDGSGGTRFRPDPDTYTGT